MDFIRIFTLLTLSSCLGAAAYGLEITTTAGGLKDAVGDNAATAATLTVSGTLDASDLFFIDKSMPSLTTLDLGAAAIEAYSGAPVNGSASYAANTFPTGVFAGSQLQSIVFPAADGLVIGDAAFAGSQLTEITIPATVSTVGAGAFAACPALASATLNATTTLGSHAFKGCTALAELHLGGAATLSESEFAGCTALDAIEGSEALTAIGANAFSGCTALGSFQFGASLTNIGEAAFMATAIADADLSATALDSISAWTFAHNDELTEVKMPATVQSIGEGAFFDCRNLADIVWSDEVRSLGDYALKGASGIEGELQLPEALEEAGSYSLKGTSGIKSLTLPSSLTSLGDNAMEGMTGLTEIDGGTLDAVPALGSDVFAGINQSAVRLNVKSEMLDAFKNAAQWQEFDINDSQVGTIAPGAQAPSLRGSYTGDALRLISNVNIESVEIYSLAGELLGTARPGADACTVATDAIGAPAMIIVRVALDGGRTAALKLAK